MKKLTPMLLMGLALINSSIASEKEVEFKALHPLPPPPIPTYQYGDTVIRYEIPSYPSYINYGSMDRDNVSGTHTPLPQAPSAPPIDEINLLYETARMYALGQGSAKDLPKAIDLFQQCIAGGHARAHFSLGVLYYQGEGDIPIDFHEAFRLFTLGTALNEPNCMNMLAIMNLLGLMGEKNPYRAYELLNMASNLGNAPAKYNLGRMYYIGDGIPKNRKLARRLVCESAELGYQEALNVLKRSCCGWLLPF